jgi:replicative superfamily II helicase
MDPDLPSDFEQLKALYLREREEKAHLLSVHTDMKTKAEAREAEALKAREEDLKKQGQYQKLLEEQTPKYEQAAQSVKRYEAVLNSYLEAELQAIPDNLKVLVPEGDPVSKLEWISKAKASGALKPSQGPAKKPGDLTPPPGGSGPTTITREAFRQLAPEERSAFVKRGGKLAD